MKTYEIKIETKKVMAKRHRFRDKKGRFRRVRWNPVIEMHSEISDGAKKMMEDIIKENMKNERKN